MCICSVYHVSLWNELNPETCSKIFFKMKILFGDGISNNSTFSQSKKRKRLAEDKSSATQYLNTVFSTEALLRH